MFVFKLWLICRARKRNWLKNNFSREGLFWLTPKKTFIIILSVRNKKKSRKLKRESMPTKGYFFPEGEFKINSILFIVDVKYELRIQKIFAF